MCAGYMSVRGVCRTEKIIEKSRFITHSSNVADDDAAKAFVTRIKSEYPDATHNCYAYIADTRGMCLRFSDDGEPSGTAGMPILEAIKNKGLVCTAVVVTRYFGGIKLGAGGLVRAYSGCCAENLNSACRVRYEKRAEMLVSCPYARSDAAARHIAGTGYALLDTSYGEDVKFLVAVPCGREGDFASSLTDMLCGDAVISLNGENFYPVG